MAPQSMMRRAIADISNDPLGGGFAPPNATPARRVMIACLGSSAILVPAIILGLFLKQYLAISNIALILLIAVQIVAIVHGLRPALVASVVSVLGYNFLFIPPLYTFTIAAPENVVTLFSFTIAALITSNLTSRVRTQAMAARSRAKTTEELYQFSRKLTGVVIVDDLLWATAYQLAVMLKVRVIILLPERGSIVLRAAYPPEDRLDETDLNAAQWVLKHGSAAGRGCDALPDARYLFLPMRTGRGVIAIVGLENDATGPVLNAEQRRLYDALSDQAALSIERIHLAQAVESARLAAEAERLRSALLTSVSHDLRTPLASILGSATSLKFYRASLDDDAQAQLINTIQDEAERLNRFISDLLDMTRLEAGAIKPKAEPIDIVDVAGSALHRAGAILRGHKVRTGFASDLPLVTLDPVLFEQALFNLLDNAAKYAPMGSTISLKAKNAASAVVVQIADEGEGIPPAERERIFDKFYRVPDGNRKRAGNGLGLAICRGFIEAMGGTIVADARPGKKGTVFTITIPRSPVKAEARTPAGSP